MLRFDSPKQSLARAAARKAARRDLEPGRPLVRRTPFQRRLVAGHRAAKHARLERAAAEARPHKQELAEIKRHLKWRNKEITEANRKLPEVAKKLEALHPTQVLARLPLPIYVFLQGLFALVEYPLIHVAFIRLPVDDRTIKLVSILVGCVLVAGMHVLGRAAAHVVRAEGERLESRRDWLIHVWVLGAGLLFYLVVVIALAVVRASEISAIGALFDGFGERHPGWLGVGLGFLQAISLAGSFYLAYLHARSSEGRAIRVELRALDQRIEKAKRQLEELETRRDRILVTLAAIDEETRYHLERLLRHHEHVESEYLAILARELEEPPLPVADWDADVDSRDLAPTTPPSHGRKKVSTNGHRSTKGARKTVRAAISELDRKE
jgi:hypothetical protein